MRAKSGGDAFKAWVNLKSGASYKPYIIYGAEKWGVAGMQNTRRRYISKLNGNGIMANLIQISGNTLINPEKIDAVEVIESSTELQLVIHIGNKTFLATKNTREVLEQIKQTDKHEQFWAGR